MILILEDFFPKDLTSYYIDFYNKNIHKSFFYGDNNTYPLPVRDSGKYVTGSIDMIIASQIDRIYNIVKKFEFCQFSNAEIVRWPTYSSMDFHKDPADDKFACVVYLNDDFVGGATIFEDLEIKPKNGTMIVFKNSKLLHSVGTILSGERYTFSMWFV
jgi:hypothetical protein